MFDWLGSSYVTSGNMTLSVVQPNNIMRATYITEKNFCSFHLISEFNMKYEIFWYVCKGNCNCTVWFPKMLTKSLSHVVTSDNGATGNCEDWCHWPFPLDHHVSSFGSAADHLNMATSGHFRFTLAPGSGYGQSSENWTVLVDEPDSPHCIGSARCLCSPTLLQYEWFDHMQYLIGDLFWMQIYFHH